MKGTTWLIVGAVAIILLFVYRASGASKSCGFLDTLLGKC